MVKYTGQDKIVNIFLSIHLNICLGCLKEPCSTLNICFGSEIRKLILNNCTLLSKGLKICHILESHIIKHISEVHL